MQALFWLAYRWPCHRPPIQRKQTCGRCPHSLRNYLLSKAAAKNKRMFLKHSLMDIDFLSPHSQRISGEFFNDLILGFRTLTALPGRLEDRIIFSQGNRASHLPFSNEFRRKGRRNLYGIWMSPATLLPRSELLVNLQLWQVHLHGTRANKSIFCDTRTIGESFEREMYLVTKFPRIFASLAEEHPSIARE